MFFTNSFVKNTKIRYSNTTYGLRSIISFVRHCLTYKLAKIRWISFMLGAVAHFAFAVIRFALAPRTNSLRSCRPYGNPLSCLPHVHLSKTPKTVSANTTCGLRSIISFVRHCLTYKLLRNFFPTRPTVRCCKATYIVFFTKNEADKIRPHFSSNL